MCKLTINGKQVNVSDNSTILEAAKSVGIKIPTLCYLEGLTPMGACRVCMVEVEGRATLVAACTTPVQEEMVIHSISRKARESR